jgi:hypothetical protein
MFYLLGYENDLWYIKSSKGERRTWHEIFWFTLALFFKKPHMPPTRPNIRPMSQPPPTKRLRIEKIMT